MKESLNSRLVEMGIIDICHCNKHIADNFRVDWHHKYLIHFLDLEGDINANTKGLNFGQCRGS